MIDFDRLHTSRHKILVVDDDRDVHVISRMILKSLTFQRRGLDILSASSAREALEVLRTVPNIAVVLLDVVMETDRSGLAACEQIRQELGNTFVRILLRTGQPGAAPERDVIQEYDIDGYLPKGDLTAARLYSAVRTSLKAFAELTVLEQRRLAFETIDDAMLRLRPYQSLETMVEEITFTTAEVLQSPEVVLHLRLLGADRGEREYSLCRAADLTPAESEMRVSGLRRRVSGFIRHYEPVSLSEGAREPELFDNGLLARFVLDHGLGDGWLFVRLGDRDRFSRHCLGLVARHAANCFYGAAAQRQVEHPGTLEAILDPSPTAI